MALGFNNGGPVINKRQLKYKLQNRLWRILDKKLEKQLTRNTVDVVGCAWMDISYMHEAIEDIIDLVEKHIIGES